MIAIRTVVCPVDLSPATPAQVDFAADVCRSVGARLVIHHNIHDLSIGAGVGWMWHADHASPQPAPVEDQLRALLDRLPPDVFVETCITHGAVTEAVLTVSEAAEADLIVLSAHAGKTADHASVIEYLLEHSRRSVLALHDSDARQAAQAFASSAERSIMRSLLVPTNLTSVHHAQVDFACDLARVFPVRLHLLHVSPDHLGGREGDLDPESIREQLEVLVPPDLADRTALHASSGDPVPEIVQAAKDLSASCIVMGEHTRVPVKRWLTHDTARAVLHEAPCPVWYVPSATPVSLSLSRLALSNERSILWGNV